MKHWLIFHESDLPDKKHWTHHRLTIGQMTDHARALAKVKFPRAETFTIWKEDGRSAHSLSKVAGPFTCR